MPQKSFIVCLLLFIANLAQAADLQLGPATLTRKKAPQLSSSGSLSAMLPLTPGQRPSTAFLKSVGGIAFDSVAEPVEGLEITELNLAYSPEQPDGRRLSLHVNGNQVTIQLYDWQMIPIARFADSDNPSCFTLFGKLEDAKEEQKVREEKNRIMNYAAPFENTLLGLRLMQLDLLKLGEESFATDLPKENDKYVLGSGESTPDLARNHDAKKRYDAAFERLAKEIGPKEAMWSTYVICDVGQKVNFAIDNNSLQLTGEPFYYFAASNIADLLELETRKKMAEGDRKLAEAIIRVQTGRASDEDKLEISKFVAEAKAKSERTYKRDLSNGHLALVPLISEMNPNVWQAGRTTMRYSAFFRYCKTKNKANWEKFLAAIRDVSASPVVETPTVMTISK